MWTSGLADLGHFRTADERCKNILAERRNLRMSASFAELAYGINLLIYEYKRTETTKHCGICKLQAP